jgi:hypothetical protein
MVFIPQLAGVSGLATEKVAIGGEPEPAPGAGREVGQEGRTDESTDVDCGGSLCGGDGVDARTGPEALRENLDDVSWAQLLLVAVV